MFRTLPTDALDFMNWPWAQIEPYYQELAGRPIGTASVAAWLADWTRLAELVYESYQRLYVMITVDTTDQDAERRYNEFLDGVHPQAQAADQNLKEKLLASGLEPAGFERPLKNLRTEAEIFSPANLPLRSQELKLSAEYNRIIGAQTILWEGEETTLSQLAPVYQEQDRARRERAWRLSAGRQLADRQAINEVWTQLIQIRCKIAENAGLPDYRLYRWKQLLRLDYTPADCLQFHQSIEQVAVPAAQRLYEKRHQHLGVERLRPWDLEVNPFGQPPLRPFTHIDQLKKGVSSIFHRVDAQLGEYFDRMQSAGLLDLENRKGKAPGGYCTEFLAAGQPFIFMNSVGLHDDVQTLIHEGGHAFHVYEVVKLPYIQQRQVGMEFGEVASMGMELLASPYLAADQGGFYSAQDAARARVEHLTGAVLFWPYMAVVDAFQHWVYENPQAASDPQNCDARWAELWGRFMIGVDWDGLEDEMATGWQRKLHIHTDPFYYVEYGLAQLGAFQVWRNALQDQAGAVAAYRKALSLGGTVSIFDLYAAAGAKFAFDAGTLQDAIDLAEKTIAQLEDEYVS
jgi:oligoendopeptidase F